MRYFFRFYFFLRGMSVHYYFYCITLMTLVELVYPLELLKLSIEEENLEVNKGWTATHHLPVLAGHHDCAMEQVNFPGLP